MSYLEKIALCNRADLARFVPFVVADAQVGWLRHDRRDTLLKFPEIFLAGPAGGVVMQPKLTTARARTMALKAVTPELIASGFPALRDELYAVRNTWGAPEVLRMDRGLVPAFGVRAYGVHVNGFMRKRDGLHLWIGTRAMDRQIEPGKLDNMVAGGQPAGLSLARNVVKECAEEASIDARRASTARPTAAISYCCEYDDGLRADTLFCFDLEMPAAEKPKPSEEIAAYALMPATEVLRLVRTTKRFKFNVNLVIIDFAVRHGLITPEKERNYEAIVAALHQHPQLIV